MKRFTVSILLLSLIAGGLSVADSPRALASAQNSKPFGLPFKTPPGLNTWLLIQQFGNTVGALNYGKYWYSAGQNLHFGIDIQAPCGTEVIAIGDGVIDQVDNFSFGLAPHNLTIFHEALGLTSVYGHLNVKPTLTKGTPVFKGDVIALSGDPDQTCVSRPHLHLEIRSRDYSIALNVAQYVDADWEMLGSVGYHQYGGFVKDVNNPNAWQTIDDQPEVDFNETPLNNFRASWPLPVRNEAPPITRPAYTSPLPGSGLTVKAVSRPGCCSWARWGPNNNAVRFWEGSPAQLLQIDPDGDPTQGVLISSTPVQTRTRDDRRAFVWEAGRVALLDTVAGTSTPISTGGALPQFSPDESKILWQRFPADDVPGEASPTTEIWVANADGSGRQLVRTQAGGRVYWLDSDRLLFSERINRTNSYKLSIHTISTRATVVMLPRADNMRGLQIAPGGGSVVMYAPFQTDPTVSGIYVMPTVENAQVTRVPWFGSYRWRDSTHLIYLPFGMDVPLQFIDYNTVTGTETPLGEAAPDLRIRNDDWSVSPDGTRILFWNAADSALYVATITN